MHIFNCFATLRTLYNPFHKLGRYLSTNGRDGPLKNIKVLDLTRIVAGPYCSMILADLGADVIKIERPGTGDEARKWGPPFINDTDETCYFMCLNRNKRSVCVDMKSQEGKDIILKLSTKCDVLIENFVPGTLNKLGLGYEDIKRISPHLIYCSITGYGSRGPYKNRPGYDVIAASYGGLMSITGPRNGPPCKVGVAVTDIATGLYAHGAILAALLERAATGKGQKIDCNLLSTQVASLINIGANYLNAGEVGEKWGSSHVSIVPYRAYATLDNKFITIGSGSDMQFQNLCEKLEIKALSHNNLYKSNKDRVANRESLDSILEAKFKTKTLEEWLVILEGASFPYGPVNDMAQVFEDEHIKDIGLVKEIKHPKAGSVKVVGPPVEFSMSTNSVYSPPPLLGQHTEEVLADVLGYSKEEIEELKNKNIV